MLRLDSITPFGKPVVPDVYCMLMTSSRPTARPRASSSSSVTRSAAERHQPPRDRARFRVERGEREPRAADVDDRLLRRQCAREAREQIADRHVLVRGAVHLGAIVYWSS